MFENINRVKRSELAEDVQDDLLTSDDHQKLDSLIIGPGGGSTFAHRLDLTVNATQFRFDGSQDVDIIIDTTTLGAATADHVHPAQVNITGNAATANRLFAPVNIGNASFDGSKDITLTDMGAASSTHTHTGIYSPADHNHDDTYSPKTHNHDSSYAAKTHTHEGYAASTHTHKYAGSDSAGGAATSAMKLNAKVKISLTGDTTGEVEFDGSKAVSIATKVLKGGGGSGYPVSRFYTAEPLRSSKHKIKMTTVTGDPYSVLFYNKANPDGLAPIKRYDNIPSGKEYELTDLPMNETWNWMYVVGDFFFMNYSLYPETDTVNGKAVIDAFCVTSISIPDMDSLYEIRAYDDTNPGVHRQTKYITDFTLGRNNIIDMSYYFSGCRSLVWGSVASLDTSKVIKMNSMFEDCTQWSTIPPIDTSNVQEMRYMFANTSIVSAPDIDMSNVIDATEMFHNCINLVSIPKYDFSNLEIATEMFMECISLINVPELNFPKATVLYGVFSGCTALTFVSVISESTILESCFGIFSGCSSLTNFKIHTPHCKDYANAFEYCSAIIEFPWFDSRDAVNMYAMCQNCWRMKSFPLIETTNVTDMTQTFMDCSSLEYCPPLDTRKCNTFYGTFQGCTKLLEIPRLDFSAAENIQYMFAKSLYNNKMLQVHGEVILTNTHIMDHVSDFIHTNTDKGVCIGYLPATKQYADDIVLSCPSNEATNTNIVAYNVDNAIKITLPDDIIADSTNPIELVVRIHDSYDDNIFEIEGFNKYYKKVYGLSDSPLPENHANIEIKNNTLVGNGTDTRIKHLIVRSTVEKSRVEVYTNLQIEELSLYKFNFDGNVYSDIKSGGLMNGSPYNEEDTFQSNIKKLNVCFPNSLFVYNNHDGTGGIPRSVLEYYVGKIGYINVLTPSQDLSGLFKFYMNQLEVLPDISLYHCALGNDMFNSSLILGLPKNFWRMTRNITEMNKMFTYASIAEVELDMSECTMMEGMFSGDSATKIILHNMKNMASLGKNDLKSAKLEEIYIDGMSSIQSLEYAFTLVPELRKLTLIGLTENLTNITNMCDKLFQLEEVHMPGFTGSSIIHASCGFRQCLKLKEIPLSDLSNAVKLGSFLEATAITDITLDLSSCDYAPYLFYKCRNLRSVKLLNTSKLRDWQYAFSYSTITKIPELDLSSLTEAYCMFYHCDNLENEQELILNSKNLSLARTQAFEGIFDDCGTVNGGYKKFIIRYPALDLSDPLNPVFNYKYISKFLEFGNINRQNNVFFLPYGALITAGICKCGSANGSTWIEDYYGKPNISLVSDNFTTEVDIYEFDTNMNFLKKTEERHLSTIRYDPAESDPHVGGFVFVLKRGLTLTDIKITSNSQFYVNHLNINAENLICEASIDNTVGVLKYLSIEGKNMQIRNRFDVNLAISTFIEQAYYNVRRIGHYESLFYDCNNLRSVIIHTDAEKLSSVFRAVEFTLDDMFSGCLKLQDIPDHIIKMCPSVNSMNRTFGDCQTLKEIPMMYTRNVTSMDYCFQKCISILDFPDLDLSNVVSAQGMFKECSELLEIPRFNLESLENASHMFDSCIHLDVTFVHWNLPKVKNMEGMFFSCFCLTHPITIMSQTITNHNSMYENCGRLHGLFNFASRGTFVNILRGTKLPIYLAIEVSNPYANNTPLPANVTKELVSFSAFQGK